MRKILFRGQTRRKGEKVKMDGEPLESDWVYGGIFPADNGERAIICQQEPEIEKFSVYADTVGQYIGLTDKNDTKIFEGDLVKYEDGRTFAIKYSESLARFIPCLPNGAFNPAVFSNCEIVGNIYDNPDWDKVKADE